MQQRETEEKQWLEIGIWNAIQIECLGGGHIYVYVPVDMYM